MVIEVFFFDVFLLLLFTLVHGLFRWCPHGSLRHPAGPTPSEPSAKAKPFPGLIKKPHCAACEAAAGVHTPQPLVPPRVIHYQRGRRREVDTYNHYCPNERCEYYGWIGRGNIRTNGFPHRAPLAAITLRRVQSLFSRVAKTAVAV